jgi:hypothetical protein
MFSRTCWKAAATKEKSCSIHRARAFTILFMDCKEDSVRPSEVEDHMSPLS